LCLDELISFDGLVDGKKLVYDGEMDVEKTTILPSDKFIATDVKIASVEDHFAL